MSKVEIRVPDRASLPMYLAALKLGWTPERDHDPAEANRWVERIQADPAKFLRWLWNPGGEGPPVTLSDGREVPRLAHIRHWIFDGEYCGDLNLRWHPGTSELPEYCDGHVGYAVVPWKRRRGIATAALRKLAAVAPAYGLQWLDIAMDANNAASRRVAEGAGAVWLGDHVAVEQGSVRACRYRLPCCGP